jgi:hypothetical protein
MLRPETISAKPIKAQMRAINGTSRGDITAEPGSRLRKQLSRLALSNTFDYGHAEQTDKKIEDTRKFVITVKDVAKKRKLTKVYADAAWTLSTSGRMCLCRGLGARAALWIVSTQRVATAMR